ncbi:uncharacterized protein LOC135688170 [Rhopilema esculentum]|uniref:uncharacterized protein LOC135688170 n=1 Tax=Rhopilema esculentum TaxID=499914 RepID=UPI0031E42E48
MWSKPRFPQEASLQRAHFKMDDDFFLPITDLRFQLEDDDDELGLSNREIVNEKDKSPSPVQEVRKRPKGKIRTSNGTIEDGNLSLKGKKSACRKDIGDVQETCTDSGFQDSIKERIRKKKKKKKKVLKKDHIVQASSENSSLEDTDNTKEEVFKYIKKLIKIGKVIEIRKLIRRIKILKLKKGNAQQQAQNSRKASSLLERVNTLKEMDFDAEIRSFATILVSFSKSDKLQSDSSEFNWVEMLKNTYDKNSVAEMCWRLLEKNGVKAHINDMLNGILRKNVGKQKELKFPDKVESTPVIIREERVISTPVIIKEERVISLKMDATHEDMDSKSEVVIKQQAPFRMKVKDSIKVQNEVNHKRVLNEKVTDKQRKKPKLERKISSKTFNGPKERKRNKGDNNAVNSDKRKKLLFEKMKKLKQKNGNRLGQRARRELWEKIYGGEAEHVKKGISLQRKGGFSAKPGYQNKRYKDSNQRHENRTYNNDKGQRKRLGEEKLHPSWQAKKMQKQQNNIVEFTGTKITFED